MPLAGVPEGAPTAFFHGNLAADFPIPVQPVKRLGSENMNALIRARRVLSGTDQIVEVTVFHQRIPSVVGDWAVGVTDIEFDETGIV